MTNLTVPAICLLLLVSCGDEPASSESDSDAETGGTGQGDDSFGGEANQTGGGGAAQESGGASSADGGAPETGGMGNAGAEASGGDLGTGGAESSSGGSGGGLSSGGSGGGSSAGGAMGTGGGEPECEGCWDADGVCQPGDTPQACGMGGGQCNLCNLACTGKQDFCGTGKILFEQAICDVRVTVIDEVEHRSASCKDTVRQNLCCTTVQSYPNPGWCTADVCN